MDLTPPPVYSDIYSFSLPFGYPKGHPNWIQRGATPWVTPYVSCLIMLNLFYNTDFYNVFLKKIVLFKTFLHPPGFSPLAVPSALNAFTHPL